MSGIDALKSLHTTLIDAEKGYETAIADAKTPEVKAIFERLAALHAGGHADVHAILADWGEEPDESGSMLAVVHKTVIAVRSAITGVDRASLPSFADGEQRIVEAYDRAISEIGGDDAPAQTLRRDRQALLAAVSEMRAMAA